MRQVQANLSEVLYAGKDNRALMVFTIATVVFVRGYPAFPLATSTNQEHRGIYSHIS